MEKSTEKLLKETLEFYSNKDSYVKSTKLLSPIECDNGQQACLALERMSDDKIFLDVFKIVENQSKKEEVFLNTLKSHELSEDEIKIILLEVSEILKHNKVEIAQLPICKYKNKTYGITDYKRIDEIIEHIDNNGELILYSAGVFNKYSLYRCKFIFKNN